MTSTQDLQQDIAGHREELAATVDALAARLDVRSRVRVGAQARLDALRRRALPVLGGAAALTVAALVLRRPRRH